jgi:LPXTG-motif cell wall-anchored protein
MFANARMSYLGLIVLTGWWGTWGSDANATMLYAKFYTGTTGYSGDFSGAGTVYNATESLSTNCPSTGSCTVDNLQTTQTYTGLTLTAHTNGTLNVWDDLTPHFGGLGVGSGTTGSDTNDNINGTNVLTLTFVSSVNLTGVGTLFDPAHSPFGPGDPLTGTFLLSVDGGSFHQITFASANDGALNLLGTTFAFEEGSNQPTFYVSALSYTTTGGGHQEGVPGPVAGAGLPGLILAGGGLLGWRRRKRKAVAAT